MQITLNRDSILKPLSYVAGVVEKRQTLPILSFILLRQHGNEVTLTGTDLEVEIVAVLRADTRGDGEMTLPARKLLDICRALPEGSLIELKKDGEKAVLRSGKSRFSLLSLPTSDFPDIQVSQWDKPFEIAQGALKDVLVDTHFCMAQQDMRYFLNGLLFETTAGKLRVVGTDGHRMAISETEIRNDGPVQKQVIVPRKGVHELSRLLESTDDPVEVHLSANHLRVHAPGFVFTSKLIDGKYPDYSRVIPASQNKNLKVEREALREALGRAAILSNEKYRGVRLALASKMLKISAHNPEQEEAQEEIAVDYSGDPLEIGFNVGYMIDAITALHSNDVIVGLSDANSSCTISAPDNKTPLYVIMPMRL